MPHTVGTLYDRTFGNFPLVCAPAPSTPCKPCDLRSCCCSMALNTTAMRMMVKQDDRLVSQHCVLYFSFQHQHLQHRHHHQQQQRWMWY